MKAWAYNCFARKGAVFLSMLLICGVVPEAGAAQSDRARIAELEGQVKGLLDREAIRALITEYGRSVDERDWVAHKAIYTDPVEVDYSSMPGAPGSQKVPIDDWIKSVSGFFANLKATQHITGVLKLDIHGDNAYALTMLHAQHFKPEALGETVQRMIGTYEVWLVRTPKGWLINRIKPNLKWNEGNYSIFTDAARPQK